MFLETERLILRRIEEADFEDYCIYNLNDPERDRMMGRDALDSIEAVRQNFDWLKDRESRGYALVLKETGRMIGNLTVYDRLSLPELPQLQGKTGKGMSFGISRQYQRRGLMEEAVHRVIAHLFTAENVDFINCGCFHDNIPSLSLQRKLGFTHLTSAHFEINGQEVTALENILWKE